ncbi:sensor histidine kinase [Clavibacter zhangzhiyongii]|uniref:sensor histidine kinase n=1 Tax=Clavibacter zhangzhiyongii TaxID=2768071 RepID=UPI00195AE507|nr:histidine kinase [Clavibacter zhangzhiyongii]MBM7026061.1 sensor domain-containing protein [Clavibacter zhangzhiyongii]
MNTVTVLWTSAVDLLIDAVLGLAWVVILVTLLSTGVGTLPAAGLGVLVLAATAVLIRGIGVVERARTAAVHDIAITPPVRKRTTVTSAWRHLTQPLLDLVDPVTWRQLLHHALSMVLGLVFVTLLGAVPQLAAAVGAGELPAVPGGGLAATVTAVLLTALLVLYVWGAGSLDRAVSPALLGTSRTAALESRVDTLTDARQGAVDAASTERLRIERDLHDGVQPRLVALAMTLGMARARMDSDPAAARELLDQAHRDAKDSITELRQLARGIHPAVLTDRGLDAALSAVASRNAVPTTIRVDLSARPRPEVEAVLYFAVAEALTNVAKHSGASRCSVAVDEVPGGIRAVISDDGRGGATREGNPGGGLGGMHDRVRAAGGTLTTSSPLGGPTDVTVEVPCAL